MTNRDPPPYQVPGSTVAPASRSGTVSKGIAVLGTVLIYAPFPIVLLVVANVVLDLPAIAEIANGDPNLFAGELSQRLVPLILALIVALLGFLVAIGAAAFGSCHQRWFFWSLLIASLLYFAAIPVGTVLSVICWLVLWFKRDQFRYAPKSP